MAIAQSSSSETSWDLGHEKFSWQDPNFGGGLNLHRMAIGPGVLHKAFHSGSVVSKKQLVKYEVGTPSCKDRVEERECPVAVDRSLRPGGVWCNMDETSLKCKLSRS